MLFLGCEPSQHPTWQINSKTLGGAVTLIGSVQLVPGSYMAWLLLTTSQVYSLVNPFKDYTLSPYTGRICDSPSILIFSTLLGHSPWPLMSLLALYALPLTRDIFCSFQVSGTQCWLCYPSHGIKSPSKNGNRPSIKLRQTQRKGPIV